MKSVYINSFEGNEIFSHIVRGENIESNYSGMIPFSLELIKLRSLDQFKVHNVKHHDRDLSDDVINVKFRQKVKSGESILEVLPSKIENAENNLKKVTDEKKLKRLNEYITYLKAMKKDIEDNIDSDKWKEINNEDLREYLYINGFTINGVHYVVYKRSSSKSRTGQCLFIKEELHKEMMNWSRMGLDFDTGGKIDYASLLAYESLVGSSLEDTISINPNNILIVSDVESKFNKMCNVVRKGDNGFLDSFREPVEVSNSLFDGESLLESTYFKEGQSMQLLRNHFFKSASFSTNIQQFFEDNNIETVEDMFGNPMKAKDVHMIITPSSLKALKFGEPEDMWSYWKSFVSDKDGLSTFGVCKHEKPSKRGFDQNENILQQTSYQMLNSMPLTRGNIHTLAKFEQEYIYNLKNDDDFFIKYIEENSNDLNSNLMFVDVFRHNREIVDTKVFRDFRKSEINKYVTHVKKGKLRLHGDYCVMLGNPIEFLYHAIGKFKNKPIALKGSSVSCTLFSYEGELVGFRNPHTSPSNVLVVKNKQNNLIDTYLNLSNNIVVVNAIDFEIQDILSGADYDSDTVLLVKNETLLKVAKKCKKFNVCINKVDSDPSRYELNNKNMSDIDNKLAKSQKYIGRVVNLGQLCMSIYWDKRNNRDYNGLNQLMRKVDVMTILSGIAIDMAKKMYDIEIEDEIKQVEFEIKDYIKRINVYDIKKKKIILKSGKEKMVDAKPLFFKYISQSKTIKNRVTDYNCSMDYLQDEMKSRRADEHENIEFSELLIKQNQKNANRKQKEKIIMTVDEMVEGLNGLYAKSIDEEERANESENIIDYYKNRVGKLTVKPDTMYALLKDNSGKSKIFVKLLNMLYTTQKEVFLGAFKK